jgi:steroid delta-isomerase-like uncharacterized protein
MKQSLDAVRDIGTRFAAGWSSGEPEDFALLFTDDCVYQDVPLEVVAHGRSEIAEHLRQWLQSSSDIRMELLRQVSDGQRVAVEWSYTGTHDGLFAGLEPTGRAFAFRGASIFEVTGDHISACVDYWNMGYLLELLR